MWAREYWLSHPYLHFGILWFPLILAPSSTVAYSDYAEGSFTSDSRQRCFLFADNKFDCVSSDNTAHLQLMSLNSSNPVDIGDFVAYQPEDRMNKRIKPKRILNEFTLWFGQDLGTNVWWFLVKNPPVAEAETANVQFDLTLCLFNLWTWFGTESFASLLSLLAAALPLFASVILWIFFWDQIGSS